MHVHRLHRDSQPLACFAAHHVYFRGDARTALFELIFRVLSPHYRLPVNTHDNVVPTQPRTVRWPTRHNPMHQRPRGILAQMRQIWIFVSDANRIRSDGAYFHPEIGMRRLLSRFQHFIDLLRAVDWNRKPDRLCVGEPHCVDSNHLAQVVDQWTSTVAAVQRSIGLDEAPFHMMRANFCCRSLGIGHNTRSHCEVQTDRAAHRDHPVSRMQGGRVTQGRRCHHTVL
mmetsp:Transcript_57357/g.100781  ORF Transcript_57357/g.100781 Transcript_57357/m.100781 type:complete len:227 (+) Transcript_57357:217-897(+)